MRTSAQFARRPLAVTPSAQPPVAQLDFSRPVSRVGTVGFAFLSLSLAAVTFVVTIWGTDLPLEALLVDTMKIDTSSVISKEIMPVAEAEVILEPKTSARLPVFGGMTPIER